MSRIPVGMLVVDYEQRLREMEARVARLETEMALDQADAVARPATPAKEYFCDRCGASMGEHQGLVQYGERLCERGCHRSLLLRIAKVVSIDWAGAPSFAERYQQIVEIMAVFQRLEVESDT